jgi:hypothetical protein
VLVTFNELIVDLEWSNAECARRTGYHANTVATWVRDNKAPFIVMQHLRLLAQLNVLHKVFFMEKK